MKYNDKLASKIYDINSSRLLLGCLLNNPQLLNNEKYILDKKDFVILFHEYLFRAIQALARRGYKVANGVDVYNVVVNKPEVLKVLEDNDYLEAIETLQELSNEENIDGYYNEVRRLSLIRDMFNGGDDIAPFWDIENEEDLSQGKTIDEIINWLEGKHLKLKNKYYKDKTIEEYHAGDGFEKIKAEYMAEPLYGMSTVSDYLNTATRGIVKGQLQVYSMTSGSGKSTIGLYNLVKVCSPELYDYKEKRYIKNKCCQHEAGLYINYEMSYKETTSKLIATISGISCNKIMDGVYTQDESDRIDYAIKILKESKIYIIVMPNFTPETISGYIKEYVISKGVGFVVFDYISEMASASSYIAKKNGVATRMDNVLSELASTLKDIARTMNVGVLSFTQTNSNIDNQEIPNAKSIAGAMAVQNKCDIGAIVIPPRKTEKMVIDMMRESGKTPPWMKINRVFHLYKMRFGSVEQSSKIFVQIDLGTGRVIDGFCTDKNNNPVNTIKQTKLEYDK